MDTSLDSLLDGSPSAQTALTRLGITDTAAAARHLQRMAGKGVAALMPYLAPALANCADADQALINMERFSSGDHAIGTFQQLAENPRAIEILVTIFAGSQFLTEILLRDPAQLETLTRRELLARQKTAEDYHTESLHAIQGLDSAAQLDALRRYQRGEILRIGASDLLDLYDLPALTGQLSNLADGLTRTCIVCSSQSPAEAEGFVVIAMGKLGGGEVNYSSDIDLLFLAKDKATDYLRLGQRLIEALSSMTPEGFMYRVDMRLRPWGRDGALVTSLPDYLTYLQRSAQLWEKQALLKARPIAGDLALGEEALKQIGTAIFGADLETVRASVHAMKQRTEEILRSKGRDWGEVKLGAGSIRDVEFVVQFLQLAYGGDNPAVRDHTTLNALPRLTRTGLLTPHEGRVLADGYIFLRTVEHYLQLMHYRQTYTLPSEPAAINLLARRLGFRGHEREHARDKFMERYSQHSTAIRRIYSKYVGGVDSPTSEIARVEPAPVFALQQHLARMEASYSATFDEEEIRNHAAMAGALDEKHLVFVDPLQVDDTWRVTVVAYDYLGELSLICGLMFAYGLDILDGQVFTYETVEAKGEPEIPQNLRPRRTRTGRLILPKAAEISPYAPSTRRKLVDVFTVKPVDGAILDWEKYAEDLRTLTEMMHSGQRREARSELAKRVGRVFREMGSANLRLYPIEIKIDNNLSEQHTVLHIQTADTVGFLYEFTNALAMTHTNILRMVAQSSGQHANDLLYVTDENGQKITAPEKQRELRAAAVLIKHFTHLLPGSANPAQALIHFREFLAHLFERPNWPDELASVEHPEVLSNLTQILGISDFLWDDFMRMQYANLFPVVSDANALNSAKSRAQLQSELMTALQTTHPTPEAPQDDARWRKQLNEFKDREMFRIDMRHLLGYTKEFWDFSEELSDLAEVVVNTAYHLSAEDLRTLHGTPRLEDGSVSQMAVVALGKCGGRELGFASDIELLFLYAGNGQTDGPERITTSVFHEKVVSHFLGAIHARHEGIFQVDLQLRPYGKAGSMAVSLDAFKRYYAPDGPAWAYERQALVKMRPIAGDLALGAQVCTMRDDFVYNGAPFDITAMRAMRERQVRHLATAGKFSAKYSPGGLVDIEYLVQGLQITHGGKNPALRQTNIRKALAALREADILNEADYTSLRKAHTFLRWLIDSMRVVRGSAKDITIPPYGSEEFAFLARRLRYGNDLQRLRDDLLRYQTDVQEINLRVLGG